MPVRRVTGSHYDIGYNLDSKGEKLPTAQFMVMLQRDNSSIPLSVTNAAMQGIVYRDHQ
jgi:hypothetical protein